MPLGMEVGLGPGHTVLDGDPAPPSKKKGLSTNFRPMSIVAKWLHGSMTVGTEVGFSPDHIVLYGDRSPTSKGHSPQILAHVCCGQIAGWIKMPLGTEVDLGPNHIVLDGDPAPPKQRWGFPPIFGPYLLRPNGWMDQDDSWYRGRLQPRPHCVIWGPSCYPKGARPPPSSNFWPMFVVAKWLDGSRCHLVRR